MRLQMTLDLGAVSRSAVVGDHWVSARPLLWFTAFLVAGAACLANAARCGRRHCYFTGLLFLLAAAYNALSEFHLALMHETVFLEVLTGAALLALLPEFFLGGYRETT